VQIVRAWVAERDAATLAAEMGPGAADIAQVVPVVRERLPGLPEASPGEPERVRLFDSIATFLTNAAAGAPLLLVLDDLQAADTPSLLLLQFLAGALGDARLLVVATYRDADVGRDHPLLATVAELLRHACSRRIELRGLEEDEVARYIELSTGTEPAPTSWPPSTAAPRETRSSWGRSCGCSPARGGSPTPTTPRGGRRRSRTACGRRWAAASTSSRASATRSSAAPR
jgi:hypothetical protein